MFDLPKVTRELRLSGYAPEYDVAVVDVWVTPPRKTMHELYEIQRGVAELVANTDGLTDKLVGEQYTALSGRTFAWLAEIWSQGADPARHFTVEQVGQLSDHLADTDPKCWAWLVQSTISLIESHREGNRKN
jgi:hypothetical protein